LVCLSEGICNRMSCLLRRNKKHAHGAIEGNEGCLLVTKQTKWYILKSEVLCVDGSESIYNALFKTIQYYWSLYSCIIFHIVTHTFNAHGATIFCIPLWKIILFGWQASWSSFEWTKHMIIQWGQIRTLQSMLLHFEVQLWEVSTLWIRVCVEGHCHATVQHLLSWLLRVSLK